MLEDPIQMVKTVTSELFQICFYVNLFFPKENSQLHTYKKLTNGALETLLNKLFTLDREKNEQIINEYIRQRHINIA